MLPVDLYMCDSIKVTHKNRNGSLRHVRVPDTNVMVQTTSD